MVRIIKWNLNTFCDMIKKRIANKFDCIIFIDGACARRIGKSTLAYKICNRIKKNFNEKKDIVYSREDVVKALANKKYDVIFADEMTNVSYKRDFYLEDQKNLLKMLDMYGDNYNLFIGVIPHFLNLDKHLLGLVNIRLTVLRRGVAIVHIPKKTMYDTDMWDIYNNKKEEMKWKTKQNYKKLSTFRGILTFTDLTPKQRERYEEVKAEKRNLLGYGENEKMKLKDDFENLVDEIISGNITDEFLKDYCFLKKVDISALKSRIRKSLFKKGVKKNLKELLKDNNPLLLNKKEENIIFNLKD